MKQTEILAPAGSMETLRAALRAGAQAVYIGGKRFSARSSAANFSIEEIEEAAKLCHKYGAKLVLAVNTIISDDEAQDFCEYIKAAANAVLTPLLCRTGAVRSLSAAVFPTLCYTALLRCRCIPPQELLCSKVWATQELFPPASLTGRLFPVSAVWVSKQRSLYTVRCVCPFRDSAICRQ